MTRNLHNSLKICSQTWLSQELCDLKELKLIVTLGNQALHYFEPHEVVGDLHGTVLPTTIKKVGKEGVSIFCSYHPSAALRSTVMNRHFIDDMTKLGEYLKRNKLVR